MPSGIAKRLLCFALLCFALLQWDIMKLFRPCACGGAPAASLFTGYMDWRAIFQEKFFKISKQ
jgi:hypothetical protein